MDYGYDLAPLKEMLVWRDAVGVHIR